LHDQLKCKGKAKPSMGPVPVDFRHATPDFAVFAVRNCPTKANWTLAEPENWTFPVPAWARSVRDCRSRTQIGACKADFSHSVVQFLFNSRFRGIAEMEPSQFQGAALRLRAAACERRTR
jgi:hypothetical protein